MQDFFLDLSLSLSLYKVAFLGKLYFHLYRFRTFHSGLCTLKNVSMMLVSLFPICFNVAPGC
jgi:hypothetical protein